MKIGSDVIVIGGGVIGCAIAYELRKAGVSVVLLEKRTIGCEASSAAAGMLVPRAEAQGDDSFFSFCLRARSLFPEFLEELRDCTGESVEWHQSGCIHFPSTDEEESALQTRFQWQKSKAIRVERLAPQTARSLEPEIRSERPAFYFPDEAHLNNVQYSQVLGRAAAERGAEIRTGQEVQEIVASRGKIRGVRTNQAEIYSGLVINAAGAWADRWGETRTPVVPVRGQMLALGAETLPVHRLVYGSDCYLVPRKGGELLVGATVEWVGYDKRNTAEAVERLLRSALHLVPALKHATYLRAWAGLRPGTPDGLPILGKDPECEGLIHATGHFRNGILLSALTGRIIAGLVTQATSSEIPGEFSPRRFSEDLRFRTPDLEQIRNNRRS